MKKVYQKPLMFEEKFTLAQSIAAGCTILGQDAGSPTYGNGEDCMWIDNIDGMTYFTMGSCENEMSDRVCYNGPVDGLVIFAS